jgi:hypothetical protein
VVTLLPRLPVLQMFLCYFATMVTKVTNVLWLFSYHGTIATDVCVVTLLPLLPVLQMFLCYIVTMVAKITSVFVAMFMQMHRKCFVVPSLSTDAES